MIFNFSSHIYKTNGTIWELVHCFMCFLTSPLYRVLQLPVGRPGVVLLLLVVICCCQFPETRCSSWPPKYVTYFLSCLKPCSKELKSCFEHCRKNNTCEASRKFCVDLCSKAWERCEEKCYVEAERQRITNNE